MDQKTLQLLHDISTDLFKEVPDLYLCSYYFSYFAFNENKHVQTIYLLLWIYFYVNYIYLQIHHHHVDMLCYYKTLTTNMSSNIFNCCIYGAAAYTFVNDFTWTHCASCLFNTAWFIFMLLLIGLTFLTHPPNKRKPRCTPFPGNMSFNLETVAKRWAPVWAWTCPWSLVAQQRHLLESTEPDMRSH